MASSDRERMMSQSSTSSDDSSMIDGESAAYAKVKGKKSSSLYGRFAVLSLGLSVVSLVAAGASVVLTVHLMAQVDPGTRWGEGEGEVCMPCDQLNPNPLAEKVSPLLKLLDVRVETREETETMICCASTRAQYATLFKLVLTRQEQVKTLSAIMGTGNDNDTSANDNGIVGKRTTVSAHLLTKPTPRDFTDDKGNRLQQWKSPSESPLSHTRGVKFFNNKLYVQSPGVYFVYCQVLYNRPNGQDPGEETGGLASHYVKRYSLLRPPSSGFLLKARHTRVGGQEDRHSSYVGGLFHLHLGDQLYVQVSVPQLVSHDDTASFFGLFKVSD